MSQLLLSRRSPNKSFVGLQREVTSFDSVPRARQARPIYQYPAMMVSPVQGAVLDRILEIRGGADWLYDPFLGSATTLIEGHLRHLSVVGRDINPLSILLAHVETCEAAPFDVETSIEEVVLGAMAQVDSTTPPDEHWCRKWYRSDVAESLQALKYTIAKQEQVEIRRFLWAALADVARLSGNHRASRPKLQTRPNPQLDRRLEPIRRFRKHAESSLKLQRKRIQRNPTAREMRADLACGDTRTIPLPTVRPEIILTSPPYGDNHLTMPYGQSSYLPMKWIDLGDIGSTFDERILRSTQSLDTASLGGSLKLDASHCDDALSSSRSLRMLRSPLRDQSEEAWTRTLSFYADFNLSLSKIVEAAAPDAHLILTLGSKTTAGQSIPALQITEQLLANLGVRSVKVLTRKISSKRLAPKNEYGGTMASESILIAERG